MHHSSYFRGTNAVFPGPSGHKTRRRLRRATRNRILLLVLPRLSVDDYSRSRLVRVSGRPGVPCPLSRPLHLPVASVRRRSDNITDIMLLIMKKTYPRDTVGRVMSTAEHNETIVLSIRNRFSPYTILGLSFTVAVAVVVPIGTHEFPCYSIYYPRTSIYIILNIIFIDIDLPALNREAPYAV